jgi:hypothetical protein
MEVEAERIQLLQLEQLASNRHPRVDDPVEASLDNLKHAVRLFTVDGQAMELILAIHSALAGKLPHS